MTEQQKIRDLAERLSKLEQEKSNVPPSAPAHEPPLEDDWCASDWESSSC